MGANTKYKDSVFSFLFSNGDLLRELYCALEGITLPADTPVTINTLSDVLFIDRVNDISFEIGGKLVILIEHQSTINPNMALRLLMYIARVYEKLVGDKKIYRAQPLPLPRPEFVVLYNGESPYPDEKILKLSDAFESAASLGIAEKETPSLELIVKVININEGRNEDIARRCETLGEYSVFVGKVREYLNEGCSREEAMRKAIKYCRDHDILKEFLEANAMGVMSMLMTEWNLEDAQQIWYEDGLEVGLEKGLVKGREEGREEGLEVGLEKGREEGLEVGLLKGKEEGREEGREETARNALAKGISLELVHDITGLDIQALKAMSAKDSD
jgi:predicted hydrolase (HD superfamily)